MFFVEFYMFCYSREFCLDLLGYFSVGVLEALSLRCGFVGFGVEIWVCLLSFYEIGSEVREIEREYGNFTVFIVNFSVSV